MTATESNLQPHDPREVIGVKGFANKSFRKRFANKRAMDRWLEANEGDIEVNYIQRV